MRLLRALTHLVLALALVSVTTAQAQAAVCAPVAATSPQHHFHQATSVAVEHTAHDHNGLTDKHPAHKHDNCQTACCFTAGQMPAHAPVARTVEFCAVQYVFDAQTMFGWAFAPDPGVPKHLA